MATRKRLVALATGLGLAGSAIAAPAALAATSVTQLDAGLTKINLVNITDFHGRIDDKGALACAVETAKSTLGEDSTLFISTGDNIGATPFVSSSQDDEPTIEYLNALELRNSSVGNHEFDKGWPDLRDRVQKLADFPYSAANVYARGTTDPVLPEYETYTVDGVKVAVVNAVTEETTKLVSPTGISALDFGDPVDAVNRVAKQLSDGKDGNGEADVIIAQYHDGGANLDRISSETVDAVDAIFLGHTHEVKAITGDRPIVQSGQYGERLGTVQLGYDAKTGKVTQYVAKVSDKLAAPADGADCLTDPQYVAARKVADAAIAEAKVVGQKVIGSITADITTAYADGKRDDRLSESTLGNLTAQIWLDSMNAPGRTGAEIGIQNPGGLRADLLYDNQAADEKPGEITLAEAAAVNPFANTLQTVDITGAQFKTLLEQQWQPEGSSRPFLKLGLSDNVSYTYDPTKPAGEHITSITYDGKPMDPKATYTVASGSFLIAGGDNFTVLQEGTNVQDSGLIDTDAFMNYFSAKSPVSPDYSKLAVAVTPYPAEGKAGQEVAFKVSDLMLTSLGTPVDTELTVKLDGTTVATAPISDVKDTDPAVPPRRGVANVTFTPKAAGELITLETDKSDTKAYLPTSIEGTATTEPTTPTEKPTTPKPTDVPTTPKPTDEPTTPKPTDEPTTPGKPSDEPTKPGKPTVKPAPDKPTIPGKPSTEPANPTPGQPSDQPGRGVDAHTGVESEVPVLPLGAGLLAFGALSAAAIRRSR